MKQHFRLGLIFSLVAFIVLMIWGSVSMYMDAELPNSPIAFTLQRYWLAAWTIISLMFGFIVFTLTSIISLLIHTLKRRALT